MEIRKAITKPAEPEGRSKKAKGKRKKNKH
jgi:ubiquitin